MPANTDSLRFKAICPAPLPLPLTRSQMAGKGHYSADKGHSRKQPTRTMQLAHYDDLMAPQMNFVNLMEIHGL